MLAKISSENMKAVGAKDAADFDAALSKFIAEANSMAENKVTLESLQSSITALEGKIISEEKIKTIVGEATGPAATKAVETWATSEAGEKIIGARASKIVMEASAATGTIPVKPAPAPTGPAAAEEKKTFAEVVQASIAGGKTKSAAIAAAVESHPKEYSEYLKTGGKI